jgi:hypothetical protein
MDELNMLRMLRKVIQFDDNVRKTFYGKFDSIQALCRFFDATKYRDKNLIELIKWMLSVEIIDKSAEKYNITDEGKRKAKEILESLETYKILDSLYEIYDSKKKGTDF